MEGAFFVLVFVGFAGVFVLVAYLANQAAKKRREAMAAYAASRGWTWTAEDPSLETVFSGTPFGLGHGRRASHALRGQHDGRPMVAFDYEYKTTSGIGKDRRTTTHHYSVIAMGAGVVFPDLAVTPQNLLSGFFGRVFDSDIELESEDFNREFVVTCSNRKFAFDVLHPQMMELLMRWTDVGWRFERDSIVAVRSGQHAPEEIDAKLAHLDAILDAVPEFVWREVKGS